MADTMVSLRHPPSRRKSDPIFQPRLGRGSRGPTSRLLMAEDKVAASDLTRRRENDLPMLVIGFTTVARPAAR